MIASWPPVGFCPPKPIDTINYTYDMLLKQPEKIPIFQTFKKGEITQRYHDIAKTLSDNIIELAPYIFESSISTLGTRCYLIVAVGELSMVDAILDNSLLQEYCIKILNKDSFQFLSLTRLAGVTLAAIIHRPEKLVKSCGFIFQFLSYIDEQPIFDFFKALFKNKPRFAKIQKWLVLSKFETIITEQIAMVSVDDLRLAYLFRLVAISEKSPILFPHFAQKKVMSKISQKITKLYEDDRLEALLAIYCKETIDVMRCFFQQVIDILKDAYIECTRCRVAALKMITKMLKYDPQLHFYIADAQLASTMNRLIVQFSCHTFLFMAIGDFAEAAFTSMVVSSRLVPDFIPMCVDMVRSETIKSIVALCCRILNSASEEAERSESFYGLLNEIPRFKTCVNGLLKNYNIIQSSKYG